MVEYNPLERLDRSNAQEAPMSTAEPNDPRRAEIARLAKLTHLDYQFVRKDAAKAMKLGVLALDREVAAERS